MAYIKDFEKDRDKYNLETRDVYNPEFNSTVSMRGKNQEQKAIDSLENYKRFISWARWYPDLFLDLLTPKSGGIKLHFDQRVFLRCLCRFVGMYGVFPRGYSKTFIEVLGQVCCAILFPGVNLVLTAQTKEVSAKLLKEKIEEILSFYPLINNEIIKKNFSKDLAEITFINSSKINTLPNSQSAKGSRRHRMFIEESALLNAAVFDDALKPVVAVGRSTRGSLGITDPCELNGQINFFTTAGYRGSVEFSRSLEMVRDMTELKGYMVIGSDWRLPCWRGNYPNKNQILLEKSNMAPTSFARNYEEHWAGASENQLVDIKKLLQTRVLSTPLFENDTDEIVLGVDVARSENIKNNKTIISVIKIIRNKNNLVKNIDLVNMFTVSNTLHFEMQAITVKRVQKQYNAKICVVDGNGLGKGILDELIKENTDMHTGEVFEAWDTTNTESGCMYDNAPQLIFDLVATSVQNAITVSFVDAVESGKLELLEDRKEQDFNTLTNEGLKQFIPFEQTNLLIEEIANLRRKHMQNGSISVERVTTKVDKDRYASVAYPIYWIMTYDNKIDNQGLDLYKAIMNINYMPTSANNGGGNNLKKIFR